MGLDKSTSHRPPPTNVTDVTDITHVKCLGVRGVMVVPISVENHGGRRKAPPSKNTAEVVADVGITDVCRLHRY